MTEEIIIDGVDVSECKYFNKVVNEEPYCNIDEEHLYTCSSDENCYYKQLKRLEQENKALNFKINQLKANVLYNDLTGIELSAKVVELKQENKELKEKVKSRENELANMAEQANMRIDRYRSALEEIRTVINQSCDKCKYNKDGIICCIGDCGEGKLKIIENKVNEVLS